MQKDEFERVVTQLSRQLPHRELHEATRGACGVYFGELQLPGDKFELAFQTSEQLKQDPTVPPHVNAEVEALNPVQGFLVWFQGELSDGIVANKVVAFMGEDL